MDEKDQKLAQEYKDILGQMLGHRLKQVILFGSRARGVVTA